jgi:hypothetical protein
MLPSCEHLPAAIWLDHDMPRSELEARLATVGRAADGWVVLARCEECGQAWRVDVPDRLQVSLAIKTPSADPALWTPADDRAARLAYLVRSYGGEGTDACIWSGCPHRALQGVALCAEHAYKNGARAKGA